MDDDFDDIPDEDLLAFEENASVALSHSNGSSLPDRSSRPFGNASNTANRLKAGGGLRQASISSYRQVPKPISRQHSQLSALEVDVDVDEFPSSAFDSSPPRPGADRQQGSGSIPRPLQRTTSGSQSFRQTTLFGTTIDDGPASQPPAHSNRVYRADLPVEAPTHHALDHDALRTWVYPTNLGPIRDYQFSIVKNSLFHNTLVALPTGLGKTFIAATVMLNYFRWTRNAKMVFVAPTKPLASQQVEACLNIAGIPRSKATLLTGETAPALREPEWESRRVFFMTPQTLMSDLSKGYADPKSIVLLVIDEAHRATGDYSYVKVVEFMRRFNKSFRVLALTATPGSTVESVQDVIDNLGVSHVEIRTEESIDIRQYVHSRSIDTVTLDPSDEILEVRDLFSKTLKPLVDKLSSQNIYYGRDPLSITPFGLMKSREDWMRGPARHLNQGTKFMINAVFSVLQGLAHAIKLLNFHGIKSFYDKMVDFRSETEGKGEKGSKYKRQILNDSSFQEMMDKIERWLRFDDFVGHPKLTYLCDTLLNHFMDAGQGSNTRAIVFSEYRDSAEEIVRVLNKHRPMISATVFVGQADSKRSEGMKQKQQIETIEKFKTGGFNVLVATSIGEEGLDIGQVDLIVCYDASASPIRMLQRMGRTGRKRAGNIVLLLMKGKEAEKFEEAKDNYETMQRLICEGSRFAFRHDLSTRIVPRDAKPEVDKRHVDIPIENTQDTSLPEPRKSRARGQKKTAKKFHMPDDVETGFVRASAFGKPATAKTVKPKAKTPEPSEMDFLAERPDLGSVLLTKAQTNEFNKLYKEVPLQGIDTQEVGMVDLGRFPVAQRTLRPTGYVHHGKHTKRQVKLFKRLGASQERAGRYTKPYGDADDGRWRNVAVPAFGSEGDDESTAEEPARRPAPRNKRQHSVFESDEDHDSSTARPSGQKKRKVVAQKQKKKPAAKPAKGRASIFIDDGGDDEDDEDDDGEDAEDRSEPLAESRPNPPARGRGRPKKSTAASTTTAKRKKGPRQRNRLKRAGDHFEELGDDCTRTSDMEETDGSDSGADLIGFIVGSDEITSSMARTQRSTSPTSIMDSGSDDDVVEDSGRAVPEEGVKEKPFFVPTHFSLTQETEDDEIPDIVTLLSSSGRKPTGKQRAEFLCSDDEDSIRRPAAGKRRAVIEDSDDE